MVEILTLEDLNNLKNEILKELKSLKQDLSSVKRKRRWLKSVEFMEFYGIKSHNTLRLMRENGLV